MTMRCPATGTGRTECRFALSAGGIFSGNAITQQAMPHDARRLEAHRPELT